VSSSPTRSIAPSLILVVALLSAIAPLATDMYLPGFTALAGDFGVPASSVQLTLTTFMVGLAVGQLVIGPLSDQWGRRRPLLVSAVICLLATAACALAPSAGALIALRFVQGFTGAAGLVLGRAVIADTASGPQASRLFGITMMIGGVAPVIAPLIGGVVVTQWDWRAVFWVLTGATALMAAGVAAFVPESLPVQRRHTGGLASMVRTSARLLRRRHYTGYVLAFCFAFGAMFSYISASPFVLEDVFGLSTTWYTVAFATNAAVMVVVNALSGTVVGRLGTRRLLAVGLTVLAGASLVLLVEVLTVGSRWATLALLVVAIGSMGLVLPNGAALASDSSRDTAGTGSALLGALQFTLAAVASPLVGLGGGTSAVPMAAAMTGSAAIAVTAFVVLTRGTPAPVGAPAPAGALPGAAPVRS
jgi:DHA1 family bicyclomycin/chloramphenicol resistance-like MFS transporter